MALDGPNESKSEEGEKVTTEASSKIIVPQFMTQRRRSRSTTGSQVSSDFINSSGGSPRSILPRKNSNPVERVKTGEKFAADDCYFDGLPTKPLDETFIETSSRTRSQPKEIHVGEEGVGKGDPKPSANARPRF